MTILKQQCQLCAPGLPCRYHMPPQPGDKPAAEAIVEQIVGARCVRCGSTDLPVAEVHYCESCLGYFPEKGNPSRDEFARGMRDEWADVATTDGDFCNLQYQLGRQRVQATRRKL